MTEMIERVARAIRETVICGDDFTVWNTDEVARAAIEAMRESAGSMQADGRDVLLEYVGVLKRPVSDQWQLARDTWKAMIDAALSSQLRAYEDTPNPLKALSEEWIDNSTAGKRA